MEYIIIFLYVIFSLGFFFITQIKELLLSVPMYLFLFSLEEKEKWQYINALFVINSLMVVIPLPIWKFLFFIIVAISVFYFIKFKP